MKPTIRAESDIWKSHDRNIHKFRKEIYTQLPKSGQPNYSIRKERQNCFTEKWFVQLKTGEFHVIVFLSVL